MKKVKKVVACLVAALLISSIASVSAFAHGGRTDSNGGHTDTKTGEYHTH